MKYQIPHSTGITDASIRYLFSPATPLYGLRKMAQTTKAVMKNADKVIIDPSAKGGNVVPYLPLNSLK